MKVAHMQAVAHDIAHHAQSSQSPLWFTLHRVCQSTGVATVTFDLLPSPRYPAELPYDETLSRAVDHLRVTFGEILGGRGFRPSDLTAARLSVAFSETFPDLDLFSTHARLNVGGRCFEKSFPLPTNEVLAVMHHERGMTLSDRSTTRAQLASEQGSTGDSFRPVG